MRNIRLISFYPLFPIPIKCKEKMIHKNFRKSTVHHSGPGAFAIRKGDWKIIFGKVEHGEMPEDPANWKKRGYLFNLQEDPYETKDVYKDHPDIVAEMNALLDRYLSE
jgi:arylsulfatase A